VIIEVRLKLGSVATNDKVNIHAGLPQSYAWSCSFMLFSL